jgi:hypothetical protein
MDQYKNENFLWAAVWTSAPEWTAQELACAGMNMRQFEPVRRIEQLHRNEHAPEWTCAGLNCAGMNCAGLNNLKMRRNELRRNERTPWDYNRDLDIAPWGSCRTKGVFWPKNRRMGQYPSTRKLPHEVISQILQNFFSFLGLR